MDLYRKKSISSFKGSDKRTVDDNIAVESQLRIRINGSDLLSIYCSPSMIRELVTGLLLSEQIIEGRLCIDRMSIEYNEEIVVDIPAEGEITDKGAIRTSGCVGGISYEKSGTLGHADYKGTLKPDELIELYKMFQGTSETYRLTGCVHNAAIADRSSIVVHSEDIGRHNAVDKVIGYCLLEKISLDDKIMLVSGRLSSEMVYKCAFWKIPFVVSRTAPTLKAIEIADASGITLIGFLREKRFNIYSGAERIL